jgi:hypothetical protein
VWRDNAGDLRSFIARIETSEDHRCWLVRSVDPLSEYSYVRVSGVGLVLAHRWLYQLLHGSIAATLGSNAARVVDHICETKWCSNPDHLQLVTRKENVRLSALRHAQMRARGDGRFGRITECR